MGAIEDLARTLKNIENGEKIALLLLDFLCDEEKTMILVSVLASLKDEMTRYRNVILTPAEREAYELVKRRGVVTFRDLNELADRFASFKYKSHTSSIMNSLINKGLVGRIKLGREVAYATPKEAVMWALKVLGKMPSECNPKDVSDLTGLPVVKVLEVISELV